MRQLKGAQTYFEVTSLYIKDGTSQTSSKTFLAILSMLNTT